MQTDIQKSDMNNFAGKWLFLVLLLLSYDWEEKKKKKKKRNFSVPWTLMGSILVILPPIFIQLVVVWIILENIFAPRLLRIISQFLFSLHWKIISEILSIHSSLTALQNVFLISSTHFSHMRGKRSWKEGGKEANILVILGKRCFQRLWKKKIDFSIEQRVCSSYRDRVTSEEEQNT